MKFSDAKKRIDAYFDSVAPGEIVRRFEALGFEFEPRFDTFTKVNVSRQPDISIDDGSGRTSQYFTFDDAASLVEEPVYDFNTLFEVDDADLTKETFSYAMAA